MRKQKIDPAVVAQLAAALGLAPAATATHPRSSRSNSRKPSKPSGQTDVSQYKVSRGPDYLGYPMVRFTTPTGREINLGFSKVRLILAHAAACQRIVSAATVTSTAQLAPVSVSASDTDDAF